ncbi:MAG: GIY-YIG nuclease family protein [Patescibacteria group bacterium]
MKKISQKIKTAPDSPGVYFFKKNNKFIYIGRATSLKKRLADYLRSADAKTNQMLREADELIVKKTANLLEAIISEANLIKKYQPEYNIREKDNRSFIYIIIPKTDWAYPLLVRGRALSKYRPEKAFVFGPLKSFSLAKNLLLVLRRIFPYSVCKPNTGKPCFHYQIGFCPGKCLGLITKEEYQKNIKNLILVLSDKKTKVIKGLKITDKLNLLKNIDDSALITREENLPESLTNKKIEAYDISHLSGKETVGAMVVFENGDFNKNHYRLFKIKTAKPSDDLSALSEMVKRRLKHKEWTYPDLILVDGGRTQIQIAQKILAENKINIAIVGIAKFKGDKLIFGKTRESLKELISLSFNQLKIIRNEAHRFANAYRKKILKNQLTLGHPVILEKK